MGNEQIKRGDENGEGPYDIQINEQTNDRQGVVVVEGFTFEMLPLKTEKKVVDRPHRGVIFEIIKSTTTGPIVDLPPVLFYCSQDFSSLLVF